jgi:hypothetical protein
MSNQTLHADEIEQLENMQVHPRVRSYVTTDAEFRAHVQRGFAAGEAGPNRDFAVIDAEISRSLQAP